MDRRPVWAEWQQGRPVITVDERHGGDGAGLHHRHTAPAEQKTKSSAVSAGEIVIFPACMRIGRPKLRITKGTDEREQSASRPERKK